MEEILTGGVNQVVRVDDRVRRPTGFWSPRVHDLLRHLDTFTGTPRFREVTADGCEVLDFLPGEVSDYPPSPAAASESALLTAASLLRSYHDAVAGYAQQAPRDGWQVPARDPVEVICHGDYAPHNCVLTGDRVTGMIDFDYAMPGPRLWDVAFAAYRWVPLTAPGNTDGFGTAVSQASRLRRFCDAYGLPPADRRALIDTTVTRIHWLVDHMRARAAAGDAAFAGHLADGHHHRYLGDADYILARRAIFQQAILS